MIRRARADEAAAVTALAHRAFAVYLPRTGLPPAPMLTDYHAAIAAGLVDVAIEAHIVAGMLLLRDRPDHLFLDVIAVDPPLAGHGIGRALLDHAEAEARRRHHPEIRLFTHAAITEPQAIYLRRGYVETSRATSEGRPRVYFSKRISL